MTVRLRTTCAYCEWPEITWGAACPGCGHVYPRAVTCPGCLDVVPLRLLEDTSSGEVWYQCAACGWGAPGNRRLGPPS